MTEQFKEVGLKFKKNGGLKNPPFLFVNSCMKNLKNIKEQILTDEKVANAVEYLLSKVVLDKPLPQLRFIYKKHKIVLGKNGCYSVYSPDGKKIANQIHFQETAKYIANHSKQTSLINEIKFIESEMFRHKEKIEFFTNYNLKKNIYNLPPKIEAMYDYYYKFKESLINILKSDNLYH